MMPDFCVYCEVAQLVANDLRLSVGVGNGFNGHCRYLSYNIHRDGQDGCILLTRHLHQRLQVTWLWRCCSQSNSACRNMVTVT